MSLNNGERFIPSSLAKKRLRDEHEARYNFAIKFAKNKRVLDIACGSGYGSFILAKNGAKEVIGIDISKDAIDFAAKNYRHINLEFRQSDATNVNFIEDYFDLIISFETIEHLDEEGRGKYLSILKKSLKKEGIILLSTPNKKITSPFYAKPLNPYHIKEFTLDELKKEISLFFNVTEIRGQRFYSSIWTKYLPRRILDVINVLVKFRIGPYSYKVSPLVEKYPKRRKEPRIIFLKAQKC